MNDPPPPPPIPCPTDGNPCRGPSGPNGGGLHKMTLKRAQETNRKKVEAGRILVDC